MDYKKYIEKKGEGLAELVKAGGGYALAFKRWNPETGEASEPIIEAVDPDELANIKQRLADEVGDIQGLQADMAELDKK